MNIKLRIPAEQDFEIVVDYKNYIKVRKKLEQERTRIINTFRKLKEEKKIKSIWRPKSKDNQGEIDELLRKKKLIEKNIKVIKEIFYK